MINPKAGAILLASALAAAVPAQAPAQAAGYGAAPAPARAHHRAHKAPHEARVARPAIAPTQQESLPAISRNPEDCTRTLCTCLQGGGC